MRQAREMGTVLNGGALPRANPLNSLTKNKTPSGVESLTFNGRSLSVLTSRRIMYLCRFGVRAGGASEPPAGVSLPCPTYCQDSGTSESVALGAIRPFFAADMAIFWALKLPQLAAPRRRMQRYSGVVVR